MNVSLMLRFATVVTAVGTLQAVAPVTLDNPTAAPWTLASEVFDHPLKVTLTPASGNPETRTYPCRAEAILAEACASHPFKEIRKYMDQYNFQFTIPPGGRAVLEFEPVAPEGLGEGRFLLVDQHGRTCDLTPGSPNLSWLQFNLKAGDEGGRVSRLWMRLAPHHTPILEKVGEDGTHLRFKEASWGTMAKATFARFQPGGGPSFWEKEGKWQELDALNRAVATAVPGEEAKAAPAKSGSL